MIKQTKTIKIPFLCVWLSMLCAGFSTVAMAAMTSPNYGFARDVIASGGDSASANHQLQASLGQSTPTGEMTSAGFMLKPGFSQVPPLPFVKASINAAVFTLGDNMIATVTSAPASQPYTADMYVLLQLPNGQFYSAQSGGGIVPGQVPFYTNWPVAAQSLTIFNYIFDGTEPLGVYSWTTAYTQPGTANVIGVVHSTPFTLQ